LNSQLTLDVLIRKGLVSEADFQKMAKEIADKRKLKNILTKDELEEVAVTLQDFKPPEPTGWAHALYIHAQKQSKEHYSADRSYDSCELSNLCSTLDSAGLQNQAILKKLENAAKLAERYETE